MAHGDAVVDADGVEFKGNAARRANGPLDQLAKGLQVNVAWYYVNVGVADGNERFVKIMFSDYAGGAQQAAMWCSLKAELDLI
jgi:hypothetical protein